MRNFGRSGFSAKRGISREVLKLEIFEDFFQKIYVPCDFNTCRNSVSFFARMDSAPLCFNCVQFNILTEIHHCLVYSLESVYTHH